MSARLIHLDSGQLVDASTSGDVWRPSDSTIRCKKHGTHAYGLFHYPSENDRRTYYACRYCFEDALGVELLTRKPGEPFIKW